MSKTKGNMQLEICVCAAIKIKTKFTLKIHPKEPI